MLGVIALHSVLKLQGHRVGAQQEERCRVAAGDEYIAQAVARRLTENQFAVVKVPPAIALYLWIDYRTVLVGSYRVGDTADGARGVLTSRGCSIERSTESRFSE